MEKPVTGPEMEPGFSKAAAGASVPSPQLDPFYKFELVVFQVENTLFRVLKHGFLDESAPRSPFHAMFATPQPDSENVEGASLESPIVLHGVSAIDFRAFLRILYPLKGICVTGYEECLGVLRLAHKWNYDGIRARAINALSPLLTSKTADKIHLGNEFLVQDWLRQGLIELVRTKGLGPDELATSPFHLDWESIAKIFYIRDKEITDTQGGNKQCPSCHVYGRAHDFAICRCRAGTLVDDIFSAELMGARFNVDDRGDNAPPLPTNAEGSSVLSGFEDIGDGFGCGPGKSKKKKK